MFVGFFRFVYVVIVLHILRANIVKNEPCPHLSCSLLLACTIVEVRGGASEKSGQGSFFTSALKTVCMPMIKRIVCIDIAMEHCWC